MLEMRSTTPTPPARQAEREPSICDVVPALRQANEKSYGRCATGDAAVGEMKLDSFIDGGIPQGRGWNLRSCSPGFFLIQRDYFFGFRALFRSAETSWLFF